MLLFNPELLQEVYRLCTTAGIGCVEDKQQLADGINRYLRPFRERRHELEAKPSYIDEVLAHGAERATAIARKTIEEVYQRMGLA